MRTTRTVLALLAAGALSSLPAAANAQDCVGAISLGSTFATETNYVNHISAPGSILTIRGVVDCFSDPVANCATDGYEYTLVYTGTSAGTVVTVGPPNVHTTHYLNGSFIIYEDATPDADPSNPATYTDGNVFLTGTIGDLLVNVAFMNGNWLTGNTDSGMSGVFTGGSALSCVSTPGAAPCPLLFTGGWNTTPSAVPPGYTASLAVKMDVECPTAVESSTMGRVKSQYR